MGLDWLFLLHSVYYRAFGYASSAKGDEQQLCKGNGDGQMMSKRCVGGCSNCFQMPLHYPRYKKSDYEKMEEWKVDVLLNEYGLCYDGTLEEKRSFAMGAFLWPDQF